VEIGQTIAVDHRRTQGKTKPKGHTDTPREGNSQGGAHKHEHEEAPLQERGKLRIHQKRWTELCQTNKWGKYNGHRE